MNRFHSVSLKSFLGLFTMLFMCAVPAYAEETPDSASSMSYRDMEREARINDTNVVFINGSEQPKAPQDSVKSLLEIFYLDQYRQFHDPEAPKFMFMTNNANLALGVGGKVMIRGWFDWNGSQDNYEFFPYNIAIPKNPEEKYDLNGSVSQSAIFMTLLGRQGKFKYMVYVQAGINGKEFVLKRAYVKMNDFTLGYANTTFEDPDALVPTVDARGPNGKCDKAQMVARYFHTFKTGLSLGGGLEIPSVAMSPVDDHTAACRNYIPDVAALAQYAWDGGNSHVRLSGLLRNMVYRDLGAGRNRTVAGWGAQLSARLNVVKPLTLYFTGIYGKGVGSYQGDLSRGNYDLVPDPGNPDRMIAPASIAVTAGAQYYFTKNVFACLAFGENRYLQKESAGPSEYKYGLYGAANVFWKISPYFTTGLEYLCGKRMNYDGQHAGANRLMALLSFNF